MIQPIDHDRIATAIAEAESRTSGEIFTVVESKPTAYPQTAFTIAVLVSFALPLAAVVLAGLDPRLVLPSGGGWSSTRAMAGICSGCQKEKGG